MALMRGSRGVLVASALVVGYLALVPAFLSDPLVTRSYYLRQDVIGAVVYVGALLLAAFCSRPIANGWSSARVPGPGSVMAIAVALVLLLWGGTSWIMLDYPLTRDELMVSFDAAIFSTGKLAEPVAVQWRPFARALVPDFALDVGDYRAFVSNYMPGNALMRAGFVWLGAPQLLNPLLAGIGFVAMWDAARRLFADCPPAIWVVLAGYALSAQVLANAMTAYAMTAHLAFNAVWLALFLRDRPWSHALAMALGAWTIGIHQIVFHPLFVGPILLSLLATRRWTLFSTYAAVYAAALIGWMLYPGTVLASLGATSTTHAGTGNAVGDFLFERVIPLLTNPNPYTAPLMTYNVLRFFVWMPVFCLPLLLYAVKVAQRREVLPMALFASFVVTAVAVTLLLAYQGHGWGYRYWHALIPGILLLCGFGFREWRQQDRQMATNAVAILGAATLLVLPFLLLTANRFIAPYDALTRLIDRQPAQFVILQTDPPGSAIDQVRNRADLTNRPLVFASNYLDPTLIRELCRRGSVTVVRKDRFALVPFGESLFDNDPAYDLIQQWLQRQPCWRPVAS